MSLPPEEPQEPQEPLESQEPSEPREPLEPDTITDPLDPGPEAEPADLTSPAGGAGSELPTMPLVEHLRELRKRVMLSLGAVLLGMGLSLTVSPRVMNYLIGLCGECEIISTQPLEQFTTYFRVALLLGIALGMPVILYQIVMFVMPALHRHERRYMLFMLPGAGVLFLVGVGFGLMIVLPRTIQFLAQFLAGSSVEVRPAFTLGAYIAFMTNLLFIIGASFQTPLVVYLMAKLGVVSTAFLSRYRKHAILVLAVLAAVMTPTPDPFTMLMVLGPMYALYELGILLARFA